MVSKAVGHDEYRKWGLVRMAASPVPTQLCMLTSTDDDGSGMSRTEHVPISSPFIHAGHFLTEEDEGATTNQLRKELMKGSSDGDGQQHAALRPQHTSGVC